MPMSYSDKLKEKLNEPTVYESLNRLLDRIESIEQTMERLETLMENIPGVMAVAVDSADEMLARANNSDTDVDTRVDNAIALLNKVTESRNAGALTHLLDQIESLTPVVEAMAQLPGGVATVTDIIDEFYRKSAEAGVDIDERTRAVFQLLKSMTEPASMSAISDIVQKADRLKPFVDQIDALPGMIAMVVDILDESMRNAVENGTDVESILRQGKDVFGKLSGLLNSQEFAALMDSGVFAPEVVKVIADAGDALVESKRQPLPNISLFKLLGEIRNPDTQKTLGFLINFARHFGQKVR